MVHWKKATYQVVVLPAVEVLEEVEVGYEVDAVEGQPAEAKEDNHGDQHAVGALV